MYSVVIVILSLVTQGFSLFNCTRYQQPCQIDGGLPCCGYPFFDCLSDGVDVTCQNIRDFPELEAEFVMRMRETMDRGAANATTLGDMRRNVNGLLGAQSQNATTASTREGTGRGSIMPVSTTPRTQSQPASRQPRLVRNYQPQTQSSQQQLPSQLQQQTGNSPGQTLQRSRGPGETTTERTSASSTTEQLPATSTTEQSSAASTTDQSSAASTTEQSSQQLPSQLQQQTGNSPGQSLQRYRGPGETTTERTSATSTTEQLSAASTTEQSSAASATEQSSAASTTEQSSAASTTEATTPDNSL